MTDPGATESGPTGRGEDLAARILAARARELARPPPEQGEESRPVVAFGLGEERYGVTLEAVLRIERVGAVSRVPGAPRDVIGVVPVDGRPCPLVDVAALLGAAAPLATAPRWAIVLGRRAPELALAADTVDLAEVPSAALAGEGPRLGTTSDARQLLGATGLLSTTRPAGAGGLP